MPPMLTLPRKTEAKILIAEPILYPEYARYSANTQLYCKLRIQNSELFKQWAHDGHTAHTILHHNQSGLDEYHKQFPLQLEEGCEVCASLGQIISAL